MEAPRILKFVIEIEDLDNFQLSKDKLLEVYRNEIQYVLDGSILDTAKITAAIVLE